MCPNLGRKRFKIKKELLKESAYLEEIVDIIKSGLPKCELREKLADYHDNDIAQSLELLDQEQRVRLYEELGAEWISEIISYVEDPADYIKEMEIDQLGEVINEMDADDAVDLLEDIDENVKVKLI